VSPEQTNEETVKHQLGGSEFQCWHTSIAVIFDITQNAAFDVRTRAQLYWPKVLSAVSYPIEQDLKNRSRWCCAYKPAQCYHDRRLKYGNELAR
jgi:hypothetical protein